MKRLPRVLLALALVLPGANAAAQAAATPTAPAGPSAPTVASLPAQPLLVQGRDGQDLNFDLLFDNPGATALQLVGVEATWYGRDGRFLGQRRLDRNGDDTTMGIATVRVAGRDRYETAATIAFDIAQDEKLGRIFLADGTDFHDGLVAGAAALSNQWSSDDVSVLLLTNGSTLPEVTKTFITNHPAQVFAIGAKAAAAYPNAMAIVGSDPVATSVAVANRFFPAARAVGVASGGSFADALAGGVHAALVGGPLLYTATDVLSAPVDGYLGQQRSGIFSGYVYGGTAAVSDAVESAVAARIAG